MFEELYEYTAGENDETGTAVLRLHVQPGAGKTAIVGRHGDAIKVRVAAPPEGGRANDAVVALVAQSFDVKLASVTLIGGQSSRSKRVQVDGISLAELDRCLELAMANARAGGKR